MPAGEVGKDLVLVAALGAGNAGLATVGYTLKNADGTTKQARTTTGVTEIGDGWYRVRALAALWTAAGGFQVDWDIATVFKASEDISIVDGPTDTSGTTTLLSRLTSGRATNLDNLDLASSDLDTELDALTTAVAALPTAASIATAVWAAATRTLSAISDSAGVTTLLSRLTSTRAGLVDNLDAAISTRAQPSDVPTAAAVSDAVWDEETADHQIAGTTGKALTDAGGGADSDPWATDIASGYTGTEAGAILNAVKAKTDLISGATSITLIAPVLASGKIVIVQGDDYKAADGRSLQWASSAWPVLTSGTVRLYLEKTRGGALFDKAGSVLAADEAQVELTAAETTAREVGVYRYALKATLSDGDIVTLAAGDLVVEEKP